MVVAAGKTTAGLMLVPKSSFVWGRCARSVGIGNATAYTANAAAVVPDASCCGSRHGLPLATQRVGAVRLLSSSVRAPKSKSFRWLDLDGAGLSLLERLSLEEALLKDTRDNWILVGRHSVWPPKNITVRQSTDNISDSDSPSTTKNRSSNIQHKTLPEYIATTTTKPNPNGMIVMGIGGKAEKLLNLKNVTDDNMLVVKRFSGGGTVVMDENAIWTTLIAGRKTKESETNENVKEDPLCKPYPRDIMKRTADAVFGPTFGILENETTSTLSPRFSLREDDYILTTTTKDGEEEARKIGGNAQAITGRQGWLHHTSFLWDYKDINMERYLKLPEKRPDYRVDRTHRDFLVRLRDHYGRDSDGGEVGHSVFIRAMKQASSESLQGGISETDWETVYNEVFGRSDETMNAWWMANRTRIQHEL